MNYNNLGSIVVWARRYGKALEDVQPSELKEYFGEHLAFTDKVSYLKWVADWKYSYLLLSTEIRDAKRFAVQYQREGRPEGDTYQSLRDVLGPKARTMIALRHAAKKISWEMKQGAVSAAVSASV